jgi:hypothetical protein
LASELTSQWIKAVVSAALVGVVAGAIAVLVRRGFDLTSPDARLPATVLLFATEIAAGVPSFAVYARRTGAVLQAKLPEFPVLTWYALHVLAGVVLGTIVATFEMGTPSEPADVPSKGDVGSLMMGGMLVGTMLGAAFGTLQALVIRKAVRAIGEWIRWSAIGGASLALFAPLLNVSASQVALSEMVSLALGFAVAVVSGVALLPAVHRLQPR